MTTATYRGMFGNYCYGPVDLESVRKGDSTLCLLLREHMGKSARAVYRGCVYWRLGESETGLHLPLVQRITADGLLRQEASFTLLELRKNSDHVETLLRDWEQEGLQFYLHYGPQPGTEYLVVARSLEYREA